MAHVSTVLRGNAFVLFCNPFNFTEGNEGSMLEHTAIRLFDTIKTCCIFLNRTYNELIFTSEQLVLLSTTNLASVVCDWKDAELRGYAVSGLLTQLLLIIQAAFI